jgi:hypothetical protein
MTTPEILRKERMIEERNAGLSGRCAGLMIPNHPELPI